MFTVQVGRVNAEGFLLLRLTLLHDTWVYCMLPTNIPYHYRQTYHVQTTAAAPKKTLFLIRKMNQSHHIWGDSFDMKKKFAEILSGEDIYLSNSE